MHSLIRLADCLPGTPYFDLFAEEETTDYPAAHRKLPDGWVREVEEEWVVLRHNDSVLPEQGWKIHMSATLESAAEAIETAQDYLLEQKWVFKFLRSPSAVMRRNGKYGERSASGKTVTIYPPDEESLERCLNELGGLLQGRPGPYILSDLRWRQGPLYVRYGSFVGRSIRDSSGLLVYVIRTPDGELVEDRRGVSFRKPEWAVLPSFLQESLDARNAGVMTDFPYTIKAALHFSNGGGVYVGTADQTGEVVLIREARPHAAQDPFGHDAVDRLTSEEQALRRLAGVPIIPRIIDRRRGYEHEFLVREFAEGRAITHSIAANPLTAAMIWDDTPSLADYATWAIQLLDQVEAGLGGMHERGIVFGDLHPGNIIQSDAGSVKFIDLETAQLAKGHSGQVIGTPGFVAPRGSTGMAVDRYALGILRLALLLPTAPLFGWHKSKLAQAFEIVESAFPLPVDYRQRILADVAAGTPEPEPSPLLPGHVVVEESPWRLEPLPADGIAAVQKSLADGILASMTPDRQDRLFPGDPAPLHDPQAGLDVMNGASGVLLALTAAGVPAPETAVEWLCRHATDTRLTKPGLLDGAAGVSLALERLDRRDEAKAVFTRAESLSSGNETDGTYGTGLAGTALAALHLAQTWEDESVLHFARKSALTLKERAGDCQRPGLLGGRTGAARLWLALSEASGEERWLDSAVKALKRDAQQLMQLCAEPNPKRPDARTRTMLMSSLAFSGGTALIVEEVKRLGADLSADLLRFQELCASVAQQSLQPQPSLLWGQAGRLLVSASLDGGVSAERLGQLAFFSLGLGGNAVMIGEDCLRLSTDLATGSAGTLALMTWLRGENSMALPFVPLAAGTVLPC